MTPTHETRAPLDAMVASPLRAWLERHPNALPTLLLALGILLMVLHWADGHPRPQLHGSNRPGHATHLAPHGPPTASPPRLEVAH